MRYRYINDVVNISLGRERLNLSGLTYTVGTRDLKQEGLNLKTSVSLTLFDADLQRPIDNRMVHPFTNISLSNLMPATLTSTVIYDYSDLSYLLYGRQKGGKFQTYLHQFDPFDLSGIRTQVLIGKNDLLLRNSDAAYAFYAVGFYYDDDDDYRK